MSAGVRAAVSSVLLIAGLVLAWPIALVVFVAAGQAAAVALVALALLVALVGWVVGGRG